MRTAQSDQIANEMDDFAATLEFSPPDMRAALVIGHPGHELLVHGWLEVTQPLVFVFTDGSGRSTQSRVASTTTILKQAGASIGSVYGRLTDAEAYEAILNHDFNLFIELARELSEAFVIEEVDYVAGDAFEGYNPMHDVCRLVINATVNETRRLRRRSLGNLQFSLVGQSAVTHERLHVDGICHLLDDAAFARKVAAAKGYVELAGEVNAALHGPSAEALRLECLRPVAIGPGDCQLAEQPPFYETYGEKQVAAGHYQRVLRYHEHIAPLAEALECLQYD